MKIYTIIGGVNGAGKSSLTGALKSERTDLGQIVDVDKITAALGGDRLAGGKAAISKIGQCLERGVCFTQETTLSGQKTARTARQAREKGYYIRLYYVGLGSEAESLQRIRNRVQKGGHDIPKEDVRRRFAHRCKDVLRVLPFCDEAVFFDNENGFVEVGEYRNGELLPKGSYVPEWFMELVRQSLT